MRTIRIYAVRQGQNRYFGGCVVEDRKNNTLTNHLGVSPRARETKQEALADAKAYKHEMLKKTFEDGDY